MSEFVPVIITLATVIVTLVGVIVWAVKFLASRLAISIDELRKTIEANTTILRGLEAKLVRNSTAASE